MSAIWRYWDGPERPPHDGWSARVIRGLHPESHLHDLTPADVLDIDVPHTVRTTDSRQWHRHVSNVVRWNVLLREGGTYLDHDIILVARLHEGLWVAGHGSPCTGAISLPAGHGLALAMVEAINAARGVFTRSEYASGEGLLAKLLPDFPEVTQIPLMFDRAGRQIATWSPLVATWHDQ